MSIKETLSDGYNGVNDDGDIVPLDHIKWEPQDEFTPDHYFGGRVNEGFDTDQSMPIKVSEQHGASVHLRDRAIAIEAIMGYFNQANKANGLRKSRGYNGFDARYGKGANEVAGNMTAKENRLYAEFMRSVNTLLARDSMIEAGFSPEEVDEESTQFIRDMYTEYGPGRADAGKRAKLVRKVNKTVRVVIDGKKR